jgi:hypothetical protein
MSNNLQLQKGVMTPDGKWFSTVTEARDYLRKPMVEAALKKVAGGDANLATFLYENEDEIMKSFEVGTVARVTKAEKNKLEKALAHLATITDNKLRFIQDNAAAVLDSFRWPSVKRMKDEEKAAATMAALTALADANAAKWIIANREKIEEAYEAGVEKRQAPAGGGLEEYQAAKKAGGAVFEAYQAKRAKAKADAKAAAKKAA